ncbi:MAG: hypothetical protein ACI4O8_09585 [Aristaeellaceae bacterium]
MNKTAFFAAFQRENPFALILQKMEQATLRLLQGVTSQQYRCRCFQAYTQNQIEAQRSGFDLERRSSGMNAL